jgi:hypothetical protein
MLLMGKLFQWPCSIAFVCLPTINPLLTNYGPPFNHYKWPFSIAISMFTRAGSIPNNHRRSFQRNYTQSHAIPEKPHETSQ